MVDVLKHLVLDRFGGTLDRFNSVHDEPTDTMDEVAVQERDRVIELFGLFDLPRSPSVRIQVARGDTAAGMFKQMQVIATRSINIPNRIGIDTMAGDIRRHLPITLASGILEMVLGITAR